MQKIFQRASKYCDHKIKRNFENCFILVSLVCFKPKRSLLKKKVVLSLYACKTGD